MIDICEMDAYPILGKREKTSCRNDIHQSQEYWLALKKKLEGK